MAVLRLAVVVSSQRRSPKGQKFRAYLPAAAPPSKYEFIYRYESGSAAVQSNCYANMSSLRQLVQRLWVRLQRGTLLRRRTTGPRSSSRNIGVNHGFITSIFWGHPRESQSGYLWVGISAEGHPGGEFLGVVSGKIPGRSSIWLCLSGSAAMDITMISDASPLRSLLLRSLLRPLLSASPARSYVYTRCRESG